eukprot:5884353-Pleurochrysis_carterae.AAC.3
MSWAPLHGCMSKTVAMTSSALQLLESSNGITAVRYVPAFLRHQLKETDAGDANCQKVCSCSRPLHAIQSCTHGFTLFNLVLMLAQDS